MKTANQLFDERVENTSGDAVQFVGVHDFGLHKMLVCNCDPRRMSVDA